MNVRPALCTEYKCSTRQLVLKAFVKQSDIQFQELGNSTPFMRLSFTVFVLLAWRSLITWRASYLFRKCNCKYLVRYIDVFKPHSVRQRSYVLYRHLSSVSKSETPCCSKFLDKCAVTKLVKKILALLETDGSLQCSSKPAICTSPEPH